MKLNKNDLITIAIVLVIPAAAYFGYFKARIARLGDLKQTVSGLDSETADERAVASDLAIARKNLRRLNQRISDFMGSVAAEGEAHKAVEEIVRDANEAGVNIELMKPGLPVPGDTLSYLPIQVAASAQFPCFYDFLLRIERSKTVLTVSNMEIESDPASERCTAKLELRVYFIQSGAGAGTRTES